MKWMNKWKHIVLFFFRSKHHDYRMNCFKWIISHTLCTSILHINYAPNKIFSSLSHLHAHDRPGWNGSCFNVHVHSLFFSFLFEWKPQYQDCETSWSNCTICVYRLTQYKIRTTTLTCENWCAGEKSNKKSFKSGKKAT